MDNPPPDREQGEPSQPINNQPINNQQSPVEQLLSRRVPPADAETALGDNAAPPADIHHRDPTSNRWNFLDHALRDDGN